MATALAWPQLLDLSAQGRIPDIGGGSGAHSVDAAIQWPRLTATVLDIAPVCQADDDK